MGGTVIEDFTTTGAGAAAGTVLTTTEAVDLAGSEKREGESQYNKSLKHYRAQNLHDQELRLKHHFRQS